MISLRNSDNTAHAVHSFSGFHHKIRYRTIDNAGFICLRFPYVTSHILHFPVIVNTGRYLTVCNGQGGIGVRSLHISQHTAASVQCSCGMELVDLCIGHNLTAIHNNRITCRIFTGDITNEQSAIRHVINHLSFCKKTTGKCAIFHRQRITCGGISF